MKLRAEKARQAAAAYAPAPEASALVYGIVGMTLFGVGIWGAAAFYDVRLLPQWALLVAGSAVAFCLGVWLRRRRRLRYVHAYQAELTGLGGQSPS